MAIGQVRVAGDVRRRLLGFAFACLGLALGAAMALTAAGSHAAVNIAVPCNGAGGGTAGLIAAIQSANNQGGGTISLAAGCDYTLTSGPFDHGHGPDGLPPIETGISISGSNGTGIVRAKSAPAFRIFEVNAGASLSLSAVALIGGDAGTSGEAIPGGGAALVNHARLIARGVTFTDNTSANGGAISSVGGRVSVISSILDGNHATEDPGATGGAIINDDGVLIVRSSSLTNNDSTAKGGAIQNPAGTATVTTSTISGNRVKLNGAGGGIFNFGNLTVTRSTISGNKAMGFAANGGGIANFAEGDLTVTDSTISGNSAGQPDLEQARGGAIMNFGTGSITTSTIAGNRVLGTNVIGGGIVDMAPLEVTASIVANNQVRNCLGEVDDGGFNLENSKTCGFADHAVNAEPRLGPLADYGGLTLTRKLNPGSPAIDQVPPRRAYCANTVDQRGVHRPQGPACDIGAFEVIVPPGA